MAKKINKLSKENKMLARQGDLIFKSVDKLPKGIKLLDEGKDYVVALGEHTGHKHVLKGDTFKVHIFDDVRFLEVLRATPLVHEEHKEITLKPGLYEIGNEREYDYFLMETRRVED